MGGPGGHRQPRPRRPAPLRCRSMPAALYQLPSSDFHVVASGSNGLPCGPGYNMVTGLGTPYANRAVQGLVASTSAATPVSPIGSAGNLAKPAAKSHITAKALVKEAPAKRPILAEDPLRGPGLRRTRYTGIRKTRTTRAMISRPSCSTHGQFPSSREQPDYTARGQCAVRQFRL